MKAHHCVTKKHFCHRSATQNRLGLESWPENNPGYRGEKKKLPFMSSSFLLVFCVCHASKCWFNAFFVCVLLLSLISSVFFLPPNRQRCQKTIYTYIYRHTRTHTGFFFFKFELHAEIQKVILPVKLWIAPYWRDVLFLFVFYAYINNYMGDVYCFISNFDKGCNC